MGKGPRILIVDDDIHIRRMLRLSLEANEYDTNDATTAEEGIALVASWHPDLVILDLMLPDKEGNAVVTSLREWTRVPIIVLTVRDSEEEKIALLDAGANDYITKPFGMGELLARIRVVLRNMVPDKTGVTVTSKNIAIDFAARTVKKLGMELKLTPTEYALLKHLSLHANKVLSYDQIIGELWGTGVQPDTSYLRVYMLQLRRKIEEDPAHPEILITEPGVGYRFVVVPR